MLKIQTTDIPSTSAIYAKNAPSQVLVSIWGGWDSIEPFITAGKKVTVIGCLPISDHQICQQARQIISTWSFANQLDVLDCEEWEEVKKHASPHRNVSI